MTTELALVALRYPPEAGAVRRRIDATCRIGRGSDNDWILPDADRKLSKLHCVLQRAHDGWTVTDRSSNGTFLNDDTAPLGARVAPLANGDRLRLGPYEFRVAIEVRRPAPPPPSPLPPRAEIEAADMTAPPRRAAPASGDAALLAAFLRGAGLGELPVADPARLFEAVGAMWREAVCGLRAATLARAAVKEAWRIEQTALRTRANNPLRFAPNDEEALAELLDIDDARAMPGAAAIGEAARELRLHELATTVAMRAAATALLATLHPTRLATGEPGGGLPFGRAARNKAENWDGYVAAHARLEEMLADRFDAVWGAPFADAYERSLAELRAAEGARK